MIDTAQFLAPDTTIGRSYGELRATLCRALIYVFLLLAPWHLVIVRLGVPNYWKEAVVILAAIVAATLPARRPLARLDLLLVGYFVLVVLSAAYHGSFTADDLRPYFFGPLIVPSIVRGFRQEAQIHRALLCLLSGTLTSAALFLLVQAHVVSAAYTQTVSQVVARPSAPVGPNLAAATLFGTAAGVLLAMCLYYRRLQLVPFAMVAVLAALSTGAVGARTAIVAGVVAGAALDLRRRQQWVSAAVGMLSIALAFVVAAAALAPELREDDQKRIARWSATFSTAVHNPVLGAGPGAVSQTRLVEYLGLEDEARIGYLPDDVIGLRVSESSTLKVMAEVGFPATALIATWLVALIWLSRRWRFSHGDVPHLGETVGMLVLIAVLVNGTTSVAMESFVGGALFWLGVALVLCRPNESSPKRARSPAPIS